MTTNILDRYGRRFSNQEPRETRPIEAVRNQNVQLIEERYLKWSPRGCAGTSNGLFSSAMRALKDSNYSSDDIRDFSLRMSVFESLDSFVLSGSFLSALINTSTEKDFEIVTEHLSRQMAFLGYGNTKNVKIKGSVGEYAGYSMIKGLMSIQGDAGIGLGTGLNGGKILVSGNAGEEVGCVMENGTIEILGNAGQLLGMDMIGGRIVIKGNVGEKVGQRQYGGDIIIEGDMGPLPDFHNGGRIYHKGKLVRWEQ